MKYLILCLTVFTFGCTEVTKVTKRAETNAHLFTETTNQGLPSRNELIKLNFYLSQEFMRGADEASKMRDISNGLLLLATAGVIRAGGLGETGEALSNQLLIALGISEGIRYSRPNAAVAAFILAAEQSSCLASTMFSAETSNPKKDSAILWEMTTRVQGDLRRRLKRDNINFVTTIQGIFSRSHEKIEDELITLQNAKRATEQRALILVDGGKKTAAEAGIRYTLLGCLL